VKFKGYTKQPVVKIFLIIQIIKNIEQNIDDLDFKKFFFFFKFKNKNNGINKTTIKVGLVKKIKILIKNNSFIVSIFFSTNTYLNIRIVKKK
jgi:hypothetical protein